MLSRRNRCRILVVFTPDAEQMIRDKNHVKTNFAVEQILVWNSVSTSKRRMRDQDYLERVERTGLCHKRK